MAFRKPVGHWDAFAPTTDSAMSFPFSPVPRQGRPGERPLRAPSTQDRRVSLLVVYLAGTIRHVELRLSLCRLDRRGEGVNVVGAVLAATVGEDVGVPATPLEPAESTSSATPSAPTPMPAADG